MANDNHPMSGTLTHLAHRLNRNAPDGLTAGTGHLDHNVRPVSPPSRAKANCLRVVSYFVSAQFRNSPMTASKSLGPQAARHRRFSTRQNHHESSVAIFSIAANS